MLHTKLVLDTPLGFTLNKVLTSPKDEDFSFTLSPMLPIKQHLQKPKTKDYFERERTKPKTQKKEGGFFLCHITSKTALKGKKQPSDEYSISEGF